MSLTAGSSPFPLHTDPNEIMLYAERLAAFSQAMDDVGREFANTRTFATENWVGESGTAFGVHIAERADLASKVRDRVPPAADALREYASAFADQRARYLQFAAEERAAKPAGSAQFRSREQLERWTAAIEGQRAAFDAQQAAATKCEAAVTKAVDAITATLSETYRWAQTLRTGKDYTEPIGNAAGGVYDGYDANGRAPDRTGPRQGRRSWRSGMRQTLGFGKYSFEEFMARIRAAKYAGNVGDAAGAAVDGVIQYLEDAELNFTDEQRRWRYGTAAVLTGGGSTLGARIGQLGGAVAGNAAVPVAGGIAAGTAGAVYGGKKGGEWANELKEWLFRRESLQGAYGGR
jgi:uncharacterized protein YukE